jgi:hypothetical protein
LRPTDRGACPGNQRLRHQHPKAGQQVTPSTTGKRREHLLLQQRVARPVGPMTGRVVCMTVQPADRPELAKPYEVIHLGGEAAAIVPLAELRRLRAVERHASPEALEEAEIEATLAAHDEWVAAGRHGARSHDDVMAELLGSDR